MRILICGSRNYQHLEHVQQFINTLSNDTEIIVGNARGVDEIAVAQTSRRKFTHVAVFEAAWETYGRSAGMKRNLEMLDQMPHWIVAFWDGTSPGTKMMIETALKRQMDILVVFDL